MEQITLEDYIKSIPASEKPIEYGVRGCKVCVWYNNRKDMPGCYWNDEYWGRNGFMPKQIYPDCKFMPNSNIAELHMCGSCEHCNQFIFEDKPEYLPSSPKNHHKSMYDPLEEPNIYCDHRDGSLNRRTAYKDLEQANFGVGHYHRQHEWDTCDRWEPER